MRSIFQRIPPMLLILLLTSLTHLIFVVSKWNSLALEDGLPIGTHDPDSWLRLTLVREWLTSSEWYNHVVPRSNAPFDPTITPWTRPLDVVTAALVYLQPSDVEMNMRLWRAALLLPWLWMTLLTLGIYRIVKNIMPFPSSYLMASLLIASTPVIWNYFGIANADHHAPMAAIFIWAMGAVLQDTPSRRAIILSGILFGLQLWISVEALILIGAVYGWYGVNWLSGQREKAKPLATLATAIALSASIALMIERPPSAWLTPINDSISILQVAVLTIAAAVAWCLHFTYTTHFAGRCWRAGIYGCGAIALTYLLYPSFFAGPMADVDPYIITDFLPKISEARPFYDAALPGLVASLIVPAVASNLLFLSCFSSRRAFYPRSQAITLLYFLLVTLTLYGAQQRWSYYLLPLSIAIVAPMLGALFNPQDPKLHGRWPVSKLANMPELTQAKYRLVLLTFLIATPFLIIAAPHVIASPSIHNLPFVGQVLFSSKHANENAIRAKQRNACYDAARQLLRNGTLDSIAGNSSVILFAPTDLGAEILFWTDHDIVASNYHREGAGIRYLWEAPTIQTAAEFHRYLVSRKIEALLLCPSNSNKRGILQTIMNGELPSWLTKQSYPLPVSHPSDSEIDTLPLLFSVNKN